MNQTSTSTGPLFFEPNYGLANRLRAMASGLELAKKLDRKLVFVWINDHELHCPFHELFQPIEDVSFKDKPYLWQFTKISNQKNLLYKTIVKFINKILGFDFCAKQLENSFFSTESNFNIYSVAKKYNNIYIQTSADFMTSNKYLQYFKPTAEIEKRILNRTRLFNEYTIGLHIRQTDHKEAIEKSSLPKFIERIRCELHQQPQSLFYLSTDNPEVEVTLKEIYGDKILIFPKNFSRNSSSGIKYAAVDLFCLSRTKRILGSYNSSFSDIASRIGNIELSIVQ